jgi:hypothetical protein
MVVAGFERFACGRVPDGFWEIVFGNGEGDAGAGAPDSGDATRFVLCTVAEADLQVRC